MTTFRDVVPTTYVCHDDLKGKDVTLTVARFEAEEMHLRGQRKPVTKPVLYFKEAKKGLVVNVTINGTLTRLYGPELEGWVGKRITLYPTTDDTGGETRRVVRVRPAIPAPAKSADQGHPKDAGPAAGAPAEGAPHE